MRGHLRGTKEAFSESAVSVGLGQAQSWAWGLLHTSSVMAGEELGLAEPQCPPVLAPEGGHGEVMKELKEHPLCACNTVVPNKGALQGSPRGCHEGRGRQWAAHSIWAMMAVFILPFSLAVALHMPPQALPSQRPSAVFLTFYLTVSPTPYCCVSFLWAPSFMLWSPA